LFDYFNFHMWPNLAILDYHHINYITKSFKKTFMEHFLFKILIGLKFEHELLLQLALMRSFCHYGKIHNFHLLSHFEKQSPMTMCYCEL
jgi:hypothetical protein